MGPKNDVLDGVKIPSGKGNFWGFLGPSKSIGSLCSRAHGKRDHSVINKWHAVMGSFNPQLDGCIVWNAHNTVLGSKRLAICATVYVGIQR